MHPKSGQLLKHYLLFQPLCSSFPVLVPDNGYVLSNDDVIYYANDYPKWSVLQLCLEESILEGVDFAFAS